MTFTVPGPPPPARMKDGFGTDDLIGLAVAAAVIGYAATVARRRRVVREAGPRSSRVVRAVAVATLPIALMVVVSSFGRNPAAVPRLLLNGLVAGGVIGLIHLFEFWLIDVALGRLRPSRSRRWLAGAGAVFAVTIMLLPILVALISGRPLPFLRWETLTLLLFSQAAAIIWWAHLPGRDRSLAEVFR